MVYGPSDAIQFKDLNTGGNSAGNGGDGYNFGNLSNHQTATFDPYNKAYGADVDVKAGDYVQQKADWDAGDANGGKGYPKFASLSADGGNSSPNGSQKSDSGHNDVKVHADTTAYQTNWAKFDQSANLIAGNGGDGGNGNYAKGGDVSFALVHSNPSTEYTLVKDVLNHAEKFSVDDFLDQ